MTAANHPSPFPGSPYGAPLSWRPAPPRPAKRRRSELAVPGSNVRMMQGAAGSDADAVFLDLEDSVAPSEKVGARALVVTALREVDYGDKALVVRINDLTTQWAVRDLVDIVEGAGERLDAIMMPKANRPEDVYAVDAILTSLEQQLGLSNTIGIEAQIETAAGMANVERIAQASPRLVALTFGPGDYAAYSDMPVLSIGAHDFAYPGHIYHYALQRIVTAAKAAGLQVIDGPFGRFRDIEGLKNSAQMAALLGCDGKWAVHPAQIAPLNEIFSPSDAEVERAAAIRDRYRVATEEEGLGAVALNDEMLDEASRKLAETVLCQAAEEGRLPEK